MKNIWVLRFSWVKFPVSKWLSWKPKVKFYGHYIYFALLRNIKMFHSQVLQWTAINHSYITIIYVSIQIDFTHKAKMNRDKNW